VVLDDGNDVQGDDASGRPTSDYLRVCPGDCSAGYAGPVARVERAVPRHISPSNWVFQTSERVTL